MDMNNTEEIHRYVLTERGENIVKDAIDRFYKLRTEYVNDNPTKEIISYTFSKDDVLIDIDDFTHNKDDILIGYKVNDMVDSEEIDVYLKYGIDFTINLKYMNTNYQCVWNRKGYNKILSFVKEFYALRNEVAINSNTEYTELKELTVFDILDELNREYNPSFPDTIYDLTYNVIDDKDLTLTLYPEDFTKNIWYVGFWV